MSIIRSYREFRDKIEKDPSYKMVLIWKDVICYLQRRYNDKPKLPSNKSIIEMCKVNDIIVLPKDVIDFLKVINGIGIIKS
jgi:hypothetical protein